MTVPKIGLPKYGVSWLETDTRVKLSQLLAVAIALMLFACSNEPSAVEKSHPNVLLVIADDLGYSDLGIYGGEIETPNIDALAQDGLVLTNFHANASCTPSRAMLLTGIDNHAVGFGANPGVARRFPEIRGRPGYRGEFAEGILTLAQRFNDAGYATYLSGKWHLGHEPSSWPPARGYERSYYFEHGGASHFADRMGNLERESPVQYWEDEQPGAELQSDFFSTTFFTDKLISYIDDGAKSGKPFFAHLAYTAPHWPLQAPDDWRDKYKNRYDQGWEAIRSERLARMAEIGLIEDSAAYSQLPEALGEWSALTKEQQRYEARRMELYAAMISHLDHEFGRLIQFLKDVDEYDNTIIVFLSDNGPDGNDILRLRNNADWIPKTFDLSYENMGRPGSYVWLGRGWAHVSATPLNLYKTFLAEGGVRVPAILKLPGVGERGTHRQFVSILDIAPTLLDAAGVRVESTDAMQGVSHRAALSGLESTSRPTRAVAMEIYGGRAVFEGHWKLNWAWPPYGDGEWKLFDIESDPGETQDLSEQHPDVVGRLARAWDEYVETNGVYQADLDFGYGRYPDQTINTEAAE